MRFLGPAALTLVISAIPVISQQPFQPPVTGVVSPGQHVYDLGSDIAAPELIPASQPTTDDQSCRQHLHGKVTLNMVLDSKGVPQSFYFIEVSGNVLDELAVVIVTGDRFKPAMRDGVPVPVRQSIEIVLRACGTTIADISGKQVPGFRLESQPSQTFRSFRAPPSNMPLVSKGVTAPFPLLTPIAMYTDEARREKVNGTCQVGLIVDAHGMPQNPRVLRSLGYGLDDMAIEAVERYRFRPAMRQDQPVAVMMSVDVNFRLR
ncbi:MAG TPA: energy transducer TonB [Terracidiphilus sp.]|nr:energy transducer TonB [Terracidiphilus sp.]